MPNSLEYLRNYLQGVADGLQAHHKSSSAFPNQTDKGIAREDALVDFLRKHVPRRYEIVKGGHIFDAQGNESKQMDIIILDDLTIQFRQHEKSFAMIEGCYFAISVKSHLDRDDLQDALKNLASVPQMPDMTGKINWLIGNREIYNSFPKCIVFAYTGISSDSMSKHIDEFYAENTHIPMNRRPELIIVNNQYIYQNTGSTGGSLRDGSLIPANTLYLTTAKASPYLGAFSMLSFLEVIQRGAGFSSQMSYTAQDYLNNLPL